jgi:hypothetical protein
VFFPSRKIFVDDVFFGLVEKTMLTYVHLALANCILAICTFDLWMSKGAHDVFVVVVNFLSSKWEAKHITIRLFEVVQLWFRGYSFWISFLLAKRSLFMLRIRVLIYRHVQEL